jgi:hypothetical protein
MPLPAPVTIAVRVDEVIEKSPDWRVRWLKAL